MQISQCYAPRMLLILSDITCGDANFQQCALSLVVKLGTINLSRGHGTKPALRQRKIKEIKI